MGMIKIKYWLLLVFGAIIMMTTINCSAKGKMEEVKVPGNPKFDDYTINFELDWDVYDSGTYSYGPPNATVRRIGEARSGYQLFFNLNMDFRFKDGREYHENIDVQSLIEEMVKNYEIRDLARTEWGGFILLVIRIKGNRLAIDYLVSESIKKKNPKRLLSKDHLYPVFEKVLY